MTITRALVITSLIFGLNACVRPYQPDIQQGNILNNSNLKQIRYGMSKQEVLYILGTPMVIDPFNESRWDYFYSNTNQRKKETSKRLITARFDGDRLIALDGDVELANVQTLEPSTEDLQHGGTVITEPTHKQKGLFTRLFDSEPNVIKSDTKKKKKKKSKE